uniref:Uncharacterized protein n=1 Tax=Arundo donax TaxID=35708 RepID=A0A0A9HG62_ARUDO
MLHSYDATKRFPMLHSYEATQCFPFLSLNSALLCVNPCPKPSCTKTNANSGSCEGSTATRLRKKAAAIYSKMWQKKLFSR